MTTTLKSIKKVLFSKFLLLRYITSEQSVCLEGTVVYLVNLSRMISTIIKRLEGAAGHCQCKVGYFTDMNLDEPGVLLMLGRASEEYHTDAGDKRQAEDILLEKVMYEMLVNIVPTQCLIDNEVQQ